MIKRLILVLPALLFFIPLSFQPKPITLLPFKGERPYRLSTYVDYRDTAKKCMGTLSDTTNSAIVFTFTLDTTFLPISSFNLIFDKYSRNNYLDLDRYDYLDVKISMREALSLVIHVKTFEYFTDTATWWTLRYTEKVVEKVDPRGSCLSFEFKKFETPSWWIDMIGKDRYRNLPEFPDYSKVMEIDFQNTPGRNQLHVPERMEIREIKFRKDLRPVLWFSLYGCFGYLLIVGIILLVHWLLIIKDKKSSKGSPVSSLPSIQPDQLPVMASDKHLQIKPRDEEDTDRLDTYLKNNYQNPDLLIETVSTQTGISTDRISVLLKKKYKMGIREYLNYLRIEEAKYQLKATDRGVAEIAFKVGYNNIPNFNRVFKELVGCAPREFREQGDGGNES